MHDNNFIHLRCRSSYSLAQGAIKIDDLVNLAKENNMPALALTDNGNLFGALEFSIKSANNGIQPIIGSILDIEVHLSDNNYEQADNCKILLLVKNNIGWKNLSFLVSKSFLNEENGVQKAISLKDLFNHSDGLICLLGGIYGPLFSYIISDQLDNLDYILSLIHIS